VDGPSVATSNQAGVSPVNPLPAIATPGSEPQAVPSVSGPRPFDPSQMPPGFPSNAYGNFGPPGFNQGNGNAPFIGGNSFMNYQAQPFMPFGPHNFMPPMFGSEGPQGGAHILPHADEEEEGNDVSSDASGHSFPGKPFGGARPGGAHGGRPGSRITLGIIRRILQGSPVDVKVVHTNKIKLSQKGHHGRKHNRHQGKPKDHGEGSNYGTKPKHHEEENKSREKEPSGLEGHHPFAAKRSRVDI